MQTTSLRIGLWAALVAAPVFAIQDTPANSFEQSDASASHAHVMQALATWRSANGDAWQIVFEKSRMHARFVYGGSMAPDFAPRRDADWFTLARRALAESAGLHRIQAATLVEDQVMLLPLANAGTTDKVTVQFVQALDGVPVIQGFANVLFDARGTLLSVDTTASPDLLGLDTAPILDADDAVRSALRMFGADTGLPPTELGTPELAIERVLAGKFERPVLVWRVDVQFTGQDVIPEGYEYRIDARSGALVARVTTIHNDVSGTVRSNASATNYPDEPSNPPQLLAMPNMTVTSPSGSALTDANGNFNIAGASAPLTVTARYVGPFATVVNAGGGGNYTLSPSLANGSGNAVDMNVPAAALVTAQANAFLQINLQRNWTRAINPADATSDFLATANVNTSGTCNAFFNGSSVNFYPAGGGCVNTAYGDVVMHEMGHWLNVRYGSGNGSDGFGEGNADVFGLYYWDDPVLGHDFAGLGSYIRTGLNNRQFCGDANGGCYGEVHNDGEVLMGALWKVRARLKTSLGNAAGIATSNTLFNSWMNAYNDTQIKTIVETHWLTLDDDDGNIGNGTPHHADIDGGFRAQGFPGHTLVYVSFANVTQLPDTQNQVGPYSVSADLTPLLNPSVASATLKYRVNNSAFVSVAMANTSGNTWSASIPGQLCTSDVDYYISATDSGAGTNTYPDAAPATTLDFTVGNDTLVYSTNFESGVQGWTHGMLATQDDWQISSQFPVNTSYGQAGDPTAATSGQNIWGNDLGPSGFNGLYTANVNNWLRSGVIDCSGSTGTKLRFQRWLRVEEAIYDQARVNVNGNVVWTNPQNGDLLDASWIEVVLDISAYADNNPSVQLEFSLQSDAGLQYGGWNIDDVQIFRPGSCVGSCTPPTTYCTAKFTSQLSLPVIGSTGTSSVTFDDFAVTLADALPNKQAICFWGTTANNQPFKGGVLCVLQPLGRLAATQTDAASTASTAIPIDASMIGTTRRYQWWFRDAPDPFHIGLSGGLAVDFCQ